MELQVSFPSGGQQVVGMLHIPERTPAPGVIMCHGFTGHKAETHRLFVTAARDFAKHGLAVLRFDFRGSGDSEGEFSEMTVSREIEDARTALDFLSARPEVQAARVAVLGLSLGGCVAACLAGADQRVRALVLWSATAHLDRLASRIPANLKPGEVFDHHGWPLGRGLLDDLVEIDSLKALAGYPGPSLVVHGSEDETVPPSDASDYRLALGGRCTLHIVKGADHVYSSLEYKAEVIELSRRFLLEAMKVKGTR
jgi:alpha/beta superfamily hydrolase